MRLYERGWKDKITVRNKREEGQEARDETKDKEGKAIYDPSRMAVAKSFGVRYLLPRFERPQVSRLIVMSQLNHLIELQELQNKVLELKQYGEYSRRNAKRLKERLQRMQ